MSTHTHTHTHTHTQLDECLYAFLLSHNENNEQLAMEDGYNLEEACSRFAHEPQIALFGKILSGEQDEDVFHYWLNAQTTLTEAFSSQQEEEVISHSSFSITMPCISLGDIYCVLSSIIYNCLYHKSKLFTIGGDK